MRHGRCARQRQACHHRQNGGESHGRDKAVEHVATHGLGHQHGSHIGCACTALDDTRHGVRELGVCEHQGDGAETDDEDQHVEVADPGGGPEHALAGFLRVGHGEEAHQDVGQAGGTEHQGHAEADGGDGVFDEATGAHDGQADLGGFFSGLARVGSNGCLHSHAFGKQCFGAETELRHHHEGHEGHARQQQAGFDDLHPGGGGHAAEKHIHHHQAAHQHHGDPVVQAEQQFDELACAHHLGDQVERHHHQRATGGKGADRRLLKAIACHVGKREFAQVAQPLGHQKGDDRPAHQEADGVDQAVIATGHHGGGNAQEGCGRHVVACNRQTVLKTGDATAAGIEVSGRPCFGGGPFGDPKRASHEQAEHGNRSPVGGLLGGFAHVAARSVRQRTQAQGGQNGCYRSDVARFHRAASLRMAWVRAS